MAEISCSELSRLLSYDPETGALTWLPRAPSMFRAEGDCRRWNSNFAGKPALTALSTQGYRVGRIWERLYRAHRVAWALANGHWPLGQIDHINGDRADNRIVNLRDATHSQNQRNAKMQRNNTSGVTGVHWVSGRRKWHASVKVGNKTIVLGEFASKERAAAARAEANVRYGFSPRHGLPA